MTSIEFGKMCKQYNIEYKNLFGYVPCPADYLCSQDEFILALKEAIDKKSEIMNFIEKRPPLDLKDHSKRY